MGRALNTTLHGVNKTHFMPPLAWLSQYGQQTIPINIVSKVAKPYLCPCSDNADRSHHQAAGHLASQKPWHHREVLASAHGFTTCAYQSIVQRKSAYKVPTNRKASRGWLNRCKVTNYNY